jgi:hypothetical protein
MFFLLSQLVVAWQLSIRVARWYILRPKIAIWVNFGGSCNGRCWYILWTFWYILRTFDIFYGHLVNFVVIWYIFPHFGILYQEKSGNPALDVGRQHVRASVSHLDHYKRSLFFFSCTTFCLSHSLSLSLSTSLSTSISLTN